MRNTTLYKLAGPKTFRRSSTIFMFYYGGNLQNIEKELRAIYHPDGVKEEMAERLSFFLQTGDLSVFTEEELETVRIFLQIDQSGAEDLVVSYDSTAADSRQCYINGIKKHTYVAMKLFKDVWTRKMKEKGGLIEDFDIEVLDKCSIRELNQNPNWRDLAKLIADSDDWPLTERYYYFAKQTVHSANYGIEAPTFQMNVLEKSGGKIFIPIEEARRFLLTYRALFPEIPERCRRVEKEVESGIIYNMLGFPYTITDYNVLPTAMKEFYAWGPQSTVGEITRIAFTTLQEYIESERKKWDIMADTHDSYLVQCRLREVKECHDKAVEFMCQELTSPVDGVKFRMKADCNIGFNWSSYKKGSNDVGLQKPKWLSK